MTSFVTADLPAYDCADPPLDRLWREAVGEDDLVYVIVSAGAGAPPPSLALLPGRKRLVTGVETVEGGFLLSPLPLHPSQLRPGEINLHARPLRPIAAAPQRLCVSLDRCGYRPLRLADAWRIARLGRDWPAPEQALEAAE